MRRHIISQALLIILILSLSAVGGEKGPLPSSNFRKSNLLCDEGYNRAADRNYDEAIILFDSALALNPDNAEAFLLRGSFRSCRGEYEEALKDLNKAIKIYGEDGETLLNRGIIYAKMGKYDKAASDLAKAYKKDNSMLIAVYNSALAFEKRGKFKKALKEYRLVTASALASDEEFVVAAKERARQIEELRESDSKPSEMPDLGFSEPQFCDRVSMEYLDKVLTPIVFIPVQKYPEQIYEVIPQYPSSAKGHRAEAYVIIQAYINKRGTVIKAIATECNKPRYGFEEAALEAAYQCRYKPAITSNGKPVGIWIEYKVNFVL